MVGAKGGRKLMKLVTKANTSAVVIFASDAEREVVKNLLTEALSFGVGLPVRTPAPEKDSTAVHIKEEHVNPHDPASVLAGKRQQLLKQDEELELLFNELVTQGPVNEEEFWSSRQQQKEQGAAASLLPVGDVSGSSGAPTQRRGVSSTIATFSAEVAATPASGNRVHYEVTPQVIHQIFIDHPSVQRAYRANVPHKMTELQFWTKYFQSTYFKRQSNRDKATEKPSKRPLKKKKSRKEIEKEKAKAKEKQREADVPLDMFMEAEREEEKQSGSYFALVDPTVNLTLDEELEERQLSARQYKQTSRYQNQVALIHKVNRHAALLVESLDLTSSTKSEGGRSSRSLALSSEKLNKKLGPTPAKSSQIVAAKRERTPSFAEPKLSPYVKSEIGESPSKRRARSVTTPQDASALSAQYRSSFSKSIRMDDLISGPATTPTATYTPQHRLVYQHGEGESRLTLAMNDLNPVKRLQALMKRREKVRAQKQIPQSLRPESHLSPTIVAEELFQLSCVKSLSRKSTFSPEPPTHDQREYRKLFLHSQELLRHHWAATSQDNMKKLESIRPSLQRLVDKCLNLTAQSPAYAAKLGNVRASLETALKH